MSDWEAKLKEHKELLEMDLIEESDYHQVKLEVVEALCSLEDKKEAPRHSAYVTSFEMIKQK
jgi:hypothetical protein